MPNYGKHLPLKVIDVDGKLCEIRKAIPHHLLKAIKNIKRHTPGSRRFKYWTNVKNRFKKHWLLLNINDLVDVQPMFEPVDCCYRRNHD